MRIRFYSDLHFELESCPEFRDKLPRSGADIVVLAGDTDRGAAGVHWAASTFDCPVIYVLGNHEFYGGDLEHTLVACREAAKSTQVMVLENDTAVIDGVRFLGCTFWTDFASNGSDRIDAAKTKAKLHAPDFHEIAVSGRSLQPEDLIARHGVSRRWLRRELETSFQGPTVVVTHFPAHSVAAHGGHPPGNDFQPFFTPEAPELLVLPVDIWISGHTHWSFEAEVLGTRLVSNQRGFPGIVEPGDPQPLDLDRLIEV